MRNTNSKSPETDAGESPSAVAVLYPGERDAPKVWSLETGDRLRKLLARRQVPVAEDLEAARACGAGRMLLLRGDLVCDNAFLNGLLSRGEALVAADGARLTALVRAPRAEAARDWLAGGAEPPGSPPPARPGEVGLAYDHKLRKRQDPFACPLTAGNREGIENRLYAGSYKGVTDLVTKYLWPRPARAAVRWCARNGVGPNAVTLFSVALMCFALVAFWTGHYGPGLLAGWLMALLDTVDGKLARVTLSDSKFGEILDHGMDLVHPPFWYMAWLFGLVRTDTPIDPAHHGAILALIFGGYIVIRLCEGYYIRRFGFHIHVWRPFDSRFRLVVSRRNPNLILLTAATVAGRPDLGLLAVVAWQCAAVAVHLAQIAAAEIASRRAPLRSWLEEAA